MKKSKVNVVINGIIQKIQMIVGVCSAAFGLLGLLVSISDFDKGAVYLCLFFIAVGALLIYFSSKRKKLSKLFKKYVQILSCDATGSISNLALQTNTPEEVVKKNLNMLIYKKFFINAYIDEEKNRVVFPSTVNNNDSEYTEVVQNIEIKFNSYTQLEEYKAVTCKNCGGTCKVKAGTVAECEYCGSLIQ